MVAIPTFLAKRTKVMISPANPIAVPIFLAKRTEVIISPPKPIVGYMSQDWVWLTQGGV